MSIISVGPGGVLISGGQGIECRDPLDGRVIWQRSDLKGRVRTLHVDDELYLSGGLEEQNIAISVRDGATTRAWDPPNKPAIVSSGALFISGGSSASSMPAQLRLFEIAGGEVIPRWSVEASPGTLMNRYGEASLALLDREGVLRLIDLHRSQDPLEIKLPLQRISRDPRSGFGAESREWVSLSVKRCGGRLLVMLNRFSPRDYQRAGLRQVSNSGLITGEVFCIDEETGDLLWPRPAQIDGQGFVAAPITPSPVAIFASLKVDPRGEQESNQRLQVIDLSSGKTIYMNRRLPAGASKDGMGLRVQLTSTPSPTIQIRTDAYRLSLTATDAPAPPWPPSTAEVESHESPDAGDLFMDGFERLMRGYLSPGGVGRRAADD